MNQTPAFVGTPTTYFHDKNWKGWSCQRSMRASHCEMDIDAEGRVTQTLWSASPRTLQEYFQIVDLHRTRASGASG